MKTKHVVIIVLLILFGGCLFVHRRVIKALITGEPMPKRQTGTVGSLKKTDAGK